MPPMAPMPLLPKKTSPSSALLEKGLELTIWN